MLRIGQVEATATQDGMYTDGNVAGGIASTRLRAAAFNATQEELCNIVETAGIQLDVTDTRQVLTALKKLFLSRANPFADIKNDGVTAVASALSNLQLRESFSGIVGDTRNARMSIAIPSATATFTADSLIVEDSAGRQYRLSVIDVNINLASAGAGGMDSGAAPVSGFVALYVIYNPTTQATALIATDATASAVPEICSGASLPAGYTASALVSVWRIANSQFVTGFQCGRSIATTNNSLLSTSASSPSSTALNIASMIPKNARRVTLSTGAVQTSAANATGIIVQSSASGVGEVGTQAASTAGTSASNAAARLSIIDVQTIYYKTIGSGTGQFSISTSEYEI